MNTQSEQCGFVLITSLIFLVVVTLLAVSAINRSTLQEKIAANTRAREIAEEHANAALRAGEAVLRTAAFDTYRPAGTIVDLDKNPQAGIPDSIHIWVQNAIPGTDTNTAQDFLKESVWNNSNPIQYDMSSAPDGVETKYFIEELTGCYQTNLDPDACATGDGVVMYRITARAKQGHATVVTQSTFAKYY